MSADSTERPRAGPGWEGDLTTGICQKQTKLTNARLQYCHISVSNNEKKLKLCGRFWLWPPHKVAVQNPESYRRILFTRSLNCNVLNDFFKPPCKNWAGRYSPLLELAHILFLALYCNPAYPSEIKAMLLWTLCINNIFKAVSASESRLWRQMERKTQARKHLQTHRIVHLYSGWIPTIYFLILYVHLPCLV